MCCPKPSDRVSSKVDRFAMSVDPQLLRRAQLRVGTTVRGKYRIDSVLGVGGMAVVYAATHRNTKRFAVKMLHPELSMHADIQMRFLREGYAANSVGHPGTVAVLDDDVAEDGAAFIVMELLDGASVDAILEKCGGRLGVRAAVGIVDELLDVLGAAHAKGIIHRDIKPANLLVTKDGSVKVLDFGIARARDAAVSVGGGHGTGTGILLGTPAFMAPEQALARSADVDAQSDVWAASATLFTLLSGQLVHQGDNVPQLLVMAATRQPRSLASAAPQVPAAIANVVDRGLAFEKNARWPTAGAMRAELRDAHRKAFGVDPRLLPLETIHLAPRPVAEGVRVAGSPVVATARLPASDTPKQADASAAGGTTEQPVAAIKAPQTTSRRGRVPLVVMMVGLVAVAVFALAAGLRVYATANHASTEASAATASTATLSSTSVAARASAPITATAPSAVPTAEQTPAIAVTDLPRATAAAQPPAPIATRYVPQAPAATPTPSAHTNPPPNCNPPFYFDTEGSRIFKKECL
jgi:serine/threonine protein kinase